MMLSRTSTCTSTGVEFAPRRPVQVRWVVASCTHLKQHMGDVGSTRDIAVHESTTVDTLKHPVRVSGDKQAVLAAAQGTLLRCPMLTDDQNLSKPCEVCQELLSARRER